MARGGVYKTDVQKARDSLLAQGKNPSVDAIRVALGNTGSKTTIHRHLKELEQEEGRGPGDKAAISDALQDLVTRLAQRLKGEAEQIVADSKERFDAKRAELNQSLEKLQTEGAALSAQLQRTETTLHEEKAAHGATRDELAKSAMNEAKLGERIEGLTTQLAERDAHIRSLEEKHAHAREALEHFRTATKEQREQDERRHEHQQQEAQVALRQANEQLTAKNHELLRLNNENSQWVERNGKLERDLKQARNEKESVLRELDQLRSTVSDYEALKRQWKEDRQLLEGAQETLGKAQESLTEERGRRERAESAALRSAARVETLEQLLERFEIKHRSESTSGTDGDGAKVSKP